VLHESNKFAPSSRLGGRVGRGSVIHARKVISSASRGVITLKEMFLMGVVEKVLESLVIHGVVLL